MRGIAVVLLLTCLALAGCTGDKDPTPKPCAATNSCGVDPREGRGGLSGVLVDPSITALPGLNVTLTPGDLTTTTDARGLFVFENLVPGSYFIEATGEGYKPIQGNAEVVEGEVAFVRLVILLDPRPMAWAETVSMDGHIDVWAGIAQFAVETLLPDGTGQCTCTLAFVPSGNVTDFVVEVFWEESTPDPAGLGADKYIEVYDDAKLYFSEYCQSPCRFVVPGTDYTVGNTVYARFTGADTWVSVNQQFRMFLTAWHDAPAPADWTIAGQ